MIYQIFTLLLQARRAGGGGRFGVPYDSSQGMPLWTYKVAISILAFIAIWLWWIVKKDKKSTK